MTYQTTITKKGQMTIPKEVREKFDIEIDRKAQLEINEDEKTIKIKQAPDIMDMAGIIDAPEGKNALEAREYMEKNYERK